MAPMLQYHPEYRKTVTEVKDQLLVAIDLELANETTEKLKGSQLLYTENWSSYSESDEKFCLFTSSDSEEEEKEEKVS